MQQGWKDNGECTFSEEVADTMHNERKTAVAAMKRAMEERRSRPMKTQREQALRAFES
jgi:hypothetical protein